MDLLTGRHFGALSAGFLKDPNGIERRLFDQCSQHGKGFNVSEPVDVDFIE